MPYEARADDGVEGVEKAPLAPAAGSGSRGVPAGVDPPGSSGEKGVGCGHSRGERQRTEERMMKRQEVMQVFSAGGETYRVGVGGGVDETGGDRQSCPPAGG